MPPSILCREVAAGSRAQQDVGHVDESAELMLAVCYHHAPVVQHARLEHDPYST